MENKVLAKVENVEITQADLNNLYNGLRPEHAQQFNTPNGVKQLLQELVHQEMFLLDAKEQNWDKEESFLDELEQVKNNLLKQYAMKKLFDTISIPEEKVKEYYLGHKTQFLKQKKVRASHILINTEEQAKEILSRLNNGDVFEDIAQEVSLCPSKENGGDLGLFEQGRMVPEFDQAAFEMEVGSISEPIKTQFGYHIIKKTEEHPEEELSFEDSKITIEKQLYAMEQNKVYLEKVSTLEGKYNATYNVE